MGNAAADYASAIIALFRFYGKYVTSFHEIHPDVMNGSMLPPRAHHFGVLKFNDSFAKKFQRDYDALKEVVRVCSRHSLSYKTVLVACHCLRWVTCVLAFVSPQYALLVGALQFVVAPLSLPVAAFKVLTYAPEGVFHYTLAMVLGGIFGGVGPVFTMDGWLLAWFFIIDQLINLSVYLAWSEPFGPLRLLRHAVYGTLDTKLYYLIVFGCLNGLSVDIGLVGLVGVLTLVAGRKLLPVLKDLLGIPCAHVLFYMDHRIAHLPVVYSHAHKMHHNLHDTTPWAAHVYGEGMNEHFFLMLLDIVPCALAPSVFCVPYCFSFYLLCISWMNKPHHTRLKPGTPYEYFANYHSDHHVLHTKNLALSCGALLDFYFGTQGPETSSTEGLWMSRKQVGESIIIEVRASESHANQ